MRKNLVTAIPLLFVIAAGCKKDHTCECTSVNTYTSSSSYGSNPEETRTETTTTAYKKVRKSKLKTLCGNDKQNYTSTAVNGTFTSTYSGTYDTKCKIK